MGFAMTDSKSPPQKSDEHCAFDQYKPSNDSYGSLLSSIEPLLTEQQKEELVKAIDSRIGTNRKLLSGMDDTFFSGSLKETIIDFEFFRLKFG